MYLCNQTDIKLHHDIVRPFGQALTSSYGPLEPTPTFNPQGYVFTLAGGSGEAGYVDGVGAAALFNDPQVRQ